LKIDKFLEKDYSQIPM